jgi:hypothetical protein
VQEGCIPPEEFVMNFLDIDAFDDIWMTFIQKMSGENTYKLLFLSNRSIYLL